ncbi:nucleotide pyrophosphohydrolase [Candidatus Dojkabacteria bacterium]|uniref:Nucleotide pyrophosphohydrolase n=1 Tax=Candidatus Dojkabacteria bacterium TaxID=2099670 RepID=A0A955RLT9_9BACT|nr:nucleotide pyrophosphohydrolase [Candidatus Dojkabacteria bacterium]
MKTLSQIQKEIADFASERGFDSETTHEKLALLTEELGELSKSIRRSHTTQVATDDINKSKIHSIEDEIGDCFIVLLDLATKLNVDAEKSINDKMKKNRKRIWE